ncbi:TonB-dependent receptor [Ancylomarina euxinus]|uniref:TonB-dependent receptor n=1 Tax=Ancylomarina euxinus TaxID=2283627 RepID=A0A425Y012_9BACT|nr:TonB-dependent receptor [Ancylomarina euxinus]MCZ4695401.1 TonB-dependent receptor [Ancylomarina euxinus]MUP15597.1 SusC/RagA family TonB-linked outer membrane protein [Ancylomarina euxinus]RRG20962.1 TonB-dependent receptor [Ancylomarina euxinus]
MNKIFYILFSFLLTISSLGVQAQITKAQELKNLKITGTLKCSEDNQPVVGATIIVKGTTNGVAADFDGNFTIVANHDDILLISSIGYASTEIKIGTKTHFDLSLSPDNVSLKEIAVIGYGVQERRDLTGAVSSVNIEQIEQVAVSVDNALAGQIAGVQVNSASGTPGSATAITIRGITSLSADNNPLYIIDGVPVYGVGAGASTSFQSGGVPMVAMGGNSTSGSIGATSEFERNPLASLNMEDIESIEVLKDAYATAIYGSRGAAGVILITTKKGKKGAPKVDFNISTSVAEPVGVPDVLSGDQYVDFYNDYYSAYSNKENYFSKSANTDWFDAAIRTAVTTNVSATVSAGTDKSTYFLSLAYLDQDSYVINNDFQRYSARINYEYKSSEKFRFGNNLTLSSTDNNSLNSGSVYRNSLLASPHTPIKDEYGDYVFVQSNKDRFNPIAKAKEDINFIKDKRVIGNLYAEYKALSWLTLRSEVGMDLMSSKSYNRNKEYKGLNDQEETVVIIDGSASQTNINNLKLVVNNTASIYKEFGEHVFNGVVGQSFEKSQEDYVRISATDFPTNDVLSIGSANEPRVDGAVLREWAMVSFFGRMNYRWKDKYMAGVTYRVDGSSRFNKNERYVGFPSFSAGWRISNENFMERYTWLDDMKLRASLGFSGISGSGGYYGNQGQYVSRENAKQYGNSNILEVQQASNPDLKWEKTQTVDVGLDLSLFDSKVSLIVDYYNKKSIDMLIESSVPLYSGYSSQTQNIVDMENEGIEVSLSTVNIDKEFKWTSNLNFAKNTNKITKLNLDGYVAGDATIGYAYYKVGESSTAWFLYDWHGVDPLTGNPLWKYADGSISTTAPASINNKEEYDNKFIMGDRMPDFTGGFTNIFSYKNWELNTLLSFSYGGKIMNGTRAELLTYTDNKNRNLSTEILDEWIIAGHKTEIPKKVNKSTPPKGVGGIDYTVSRQTDRFLEDGSYIRLKNISLSYRFNPDIIRKIGLRSLVLYAKGSNLVTWTNYSGPDPEVSAFGSSATYAGNDELTIPQQKAIQIGVKIGLR